jgi:hypothetical protein
LKPKDLAPRHLGNNWTGFCKTGSPATFHRSSGLEGIFIRSTISVNCTFELEKMDTLLRDGVDLGALTGSSFIGDAYFFEETTSPAKIREYLDSFKVSFSKSIYSYFSLMKSI